MKTYTWKEAFEDAYGAAKAGNTRAQTFVGYCYDVGRGTRRNQEKARQWYEKAARKGNVAAIFNLAVVNDKGLGGKRNASRAVSLYRRAALRGDLQSQANLAVMRWQMRSEKARMCGEGFLISTVRPLPRSKRERCPETGKRTSIAKPLKREVHHSVPCPFPPRSAWWSN